MSDEFITITDAPAIAGLRFRHFRGEADLPAMVKAIDASAEADKIERATTLEDLVNSYSHLTNCDPFQDMIFAEINGEVIGYSRGWWSEEPAPGPYVYFFVGFLVPAWRRKGIGRVMLGWIEKRLREIAAGHPAERGKFFQAMANQFETGTAAMLEKSSYSPNRFFFHMVRPSLDDIPDLPLPDGLQVRTALPEHYRQIWDSAAEAFQDHWGFTLPSEQDYQSWVEDKNFFQPELWQVAWDVASNQPAGHVLTFVNHAENEKFGRKRGYTENISVRRAWRKRGLARALIVRSLQAQKQIGMTESALSVDTENLSGATRVYEDCGFKVVRKDTIYRKAL
jgi:GNAT superfamily N-acetyltransferase